MAREFAELNGRESELSKKPEEDLYVNWYKRAFYTISRSRQSGFSLGYIPLSAIVDYGNNIGHVEDDIRDFVEIINSMDDVYLAHINKK